MSACWGEISKHSAATLYEAAGRGGALPDRIRPLWQGARTCGYAFTVRTAERDNIWIHRAIYAAAPLDVLVVSCDAGPSAGYWGELMTLAAQRRRLGGLVIDGGVRDVEAITRLGFPVFQSGISIEGTKKESAAPGALDEALVIGDTTVEPGDLIVGDGDGVVAISRARTAEVLEAAAAWERREGILRRKIASGEPLLDLLEKL